MDPDASLNFEGGEVIYENAKVGEWVKFWKAITATIFGLSPGLYIFEIYAGDGTPSLQWMADQWSWWDIPRQFQDGSGWDLEGYRYCDDHEYMNFQYSGKRTIVRSSHTMYVATLMALMYKLDFDYATKVRYNKDKDLVFVTRPNRFWGEQETVYEVHHLEQMVPATVTAVKDMGQMQKDGILTIKCMAQNENIKLYNDKKYWNADLRKEFLRETSTLWKDTFADQTTGNIFQTRGGQSKDMQLAYEQIDREMEAAVAKHGPVKIP